jgi:putative transposase
MCEVAGFSRTGYYRFRNAATPATAEMDLRDEMQKVALEWPAYGSRRMTQELKARGWEVNRKRVQRLMREDNLVCVVKRKFVVTTDSAHGLKIYRNLARSMILTGVDQLWVADITYIRLAEEFVYLAVVLDAYSRRVIGWHLSDGLDNSLTLTALRMALEQRMVRPGLVHHSDRGVQYASGDYTDLLKANGIGISMSRQANPCGGKRSLRPQPWIPRGESSGLEFAHGPGQCAAEIILGMRVPARETRTARTQNGGSLWRGDSPAQQFLGNPFIRNAPNR